MVGNVLAEDPISSGTIPLFLHLFAYDVDKNKKE